MRVEQVRVAVKNLPLPKLAWATSAFFLSSRLVCWTWFKQRLTSG
jgi:hypothetical protein